MPETVNGYDEECLNQGEFEVIHQRLQNSVLVTKLCVYVLNSVVF